MDGKERWSNQKDDGQNVLYDEFGVVIGWNDIRTKKARSKTYPGIADAIAEQWCKETTGLYHPDLFN